MANFLSSKATLERLCETDKPRNARNGAKMLAIGTLTASGTALTGYLGFVKSTDSENPYVHAVAIGAAALCDFVAIISGVVTAGAFYDGISSFTRPLMRGKDDGNIYYRNNGFTRRATRSDRFFGSKVIPIESNDDFVHMPICNSYVLLNGVYVKDTKVTMNNLAMTFDPATRTGVPDAKHSSVLETEVKGCFYGKDIEIVANDEETAKKLADVPQGTSIYAFGMYSGHNQLMLEKFGEAL